MIANSDTDRLVRRAHGVRHDIADEGLAQAADVVSALVEPCDRLGRGPDLCVPGSGRALLSARRSSA